MFNFFARFSRAHNLKRTQEQFCVLFQTMFTHQFTSTFGSGLHIFWIILLTLSSFKYLLSKSKLFRCDLLLRNRLTHFSISVWLYLAESFIFFLPFCSDYLLYNCPPMLYMPACTFLPYVHYFDIELCLILLGQDIHQPMNRSSPLIFFLQ